ncbi:MAG TPA: tetratricopeptide repeat protein, partial [bacterium]|nr:tetratricopeptide repeat protein [bacterium]
QAAPYFSAALQLDPNDLRALTGKANCESVLGQLDQALADYRRLQSIQPGDQPLADLIRQLEARTKKTPEAPPVSTALSSPPSNAFQQGLVLYNQKQFAAAVPFLQGAVEENPKDPEAYQYLGLAQIQAGNLKEGDLALEEYNYLRPDPPTANYALQVRKRLTPPDQMWVDARLSEAGMAPRAPGPVVQKPYGAYLVPAFGSLQLTGLETNAKSWQAFAKQQQGFDSSFHFEGSVPTAALAVGLEPVLKLSKNFQVGIPFSFSPVGEARDEVSNTNKVDDYVDSFNITELSLGLDLKYLIFCGGFEPFVSVAPFFAPIAIDYGAQATSGGTTQKVTGNYEGDNVGAVFKLGADLHLDDTFVVTPFLGYVFSS